MPSALDLKLLLLIAVANGTPVMATALLRDRVAYPLDCRATLKDGWPLLGASKSFRGVVLSLAVTTVAAPLLGLDWWLGLLVGALAMAGDLFSSFLKRRMRLAPSSMALGLDQIPESLFPMLGAAYFLSLSAWEVVAVVAAFFVGELLLSRVLFRLRIRSQPY
jgi:hypothetical protein